jgi:hypothetical protein
MPQRPRHRPCAVATLVAAGALGLTGPVESGATRPPDRTAADIVAAMRRGDENHRTMAVGVIRGLEEAQQRALLPLLTHLVAGRREAPAGRAAAAEGLARLRVASPAEVTALLAVVRRHVEPAVVRTAAAEALRSVARHFPGDFSAASPADSLLPVIEDRGAPEALRESAAAVLSALPRQIGPAHMERLIAVYRERAQPATVRGAALLAIGAMAGAAKAALPSLRAGIADDHEDARLRQVTRLVAERIEVAAAGVAPASVPETLPVH